VAAEVRRRSRARTRKPAVNQLGLLSPTACAGAARAAPRASGCPPAGARGRQGRQRRGCGARCQRAAGAPLQLLLVLAQVQRVKAEVARHAARRGRARRGASVSSRAMISSGGAPLRRRPRQRACRRGAPAHRCPGSTARCARSQRARPRPASGRGARRRQARRQTPRGSEALLPRTHRRALGRLHAQRDAREAGDLARKHFRRVGAGNGAPGPGRFFLCRPAAILHPLRRHGCVRRLCACVCVCWQAAARCQQRHRRQDVREAVVVPGRQGARAAACARLRPAGARPAPPLTRRAAPPRCRASWTRHT
jgi:hypothetical protein